MFNNRTIRQRDFVIKIFTVILMFVCVLFPITLFGIIGALYYANRAAFSLFLSVMLFVAAILFTSYCVLRKCKYGQLSVDPYIFNTRFISFEEFKRKGTDGLGVTALDEQSLVIRNDKNKLNPLFVVDITQNHFYSLQAILESLLQLAIEKEALPKQAFGRYEAYFVFVLFVNKQNIHPNVKKDIETELNRNASFSMYRLISCVDEEGKLIIPAFWGSTFFWEKPYLNAINRVLNSLVSYGTNDTGDG